MLREATGAGEVLATAWFGAWEFWKTRLAAWPRISTVDMAGVLFSRGLLVVFFSDARFGTGFGDGTSSMLAISAVFFADLESGGEEDAERFPGPLATGTGPLVMGGSVEGSASAGTPEVNFTRPGILSYAPRFLMVN